MVNIKGCVMTDENKPEEKKSKWGIKMPDLKSISEAANKAVAAGKAAGEKAVQASKDASDKAMAAGKAAGEKASQAAKDAVKKKDEKPEEKKDKPSP
jgi:hypothetical protein